MKKIYVLALLAVLCSCSEKDDLTNKTTGRVTFTATIKEEAETKTTLGAKDSEGKHKILWSEGDCISVYDVCTEPSNSKFDIESGEGSASASFSGDCVPSDRGYYAVYPYNEKNRLVPYSVGNIYYPYCYWDGTEQVAHKGGWDPSKAVMMAYAEPEDGNVNLNFKSAVSFVKLTTDYKCKSITFESNDEDEDIACDGFRCEYNDSEGSFTINETQYPSNKIVLKADESGVIEPGTYYIAVLPGTLDEGFTLTFQSATNESKTWEKSTDKSTTLTRAKILNLGTINMASDLAEFAGSGTEEDPYQISDLQELKLLATRTNGGVSGFENPYYIQTADIDAKNTSLTPIGNSDHNFAGKYDGGNHVIKNAVFEHFENDGMYAAGLFGDLYNATIKNVSVENCTVKNLGQSKNPQLVFGLIAAHAYSSDEYYCTITNCSASGTITYDAYSKDCGAYEAGGILGASNANITISHCTSNVTFDNLYLSRLEGASIGGILGYAGPVKNKPDNSADSDALVNIDRCRNNGQVVYQIHDDVAKTDAAIGGIIGRSYDALLHETAVHLSNCVNTGLIGEINENESEVSVGGIFGKNDSDGSSSMRPWLFNCLNKGTIRSAAKSGCAGGIIGYNYSDDTTISMCVHAGHFNISYSIDYGAISGKRAGTYHHVFNTDSSEIPLRGSSGGDSSFTDGSGYRSDLTVSGLKDYLSNYTDKDAASWKYVDASSETLEFDLDF